MKHIFKLSLISICLIIILSSCTDSKTGFAVVIDTGSEEILLYKHAIATITDAGGKD